MLRFIRHGFFGSNHDGTHSDWTTQNTISSPCEKASGHMSFVAGLGLEASCAFLL